ncbi:MAG: hypothetical protein Q8Q40_13955, partial [Methylococcaceae bacterium]|nr:hypothetical protein [Methylococcaceae bacterium]
SASEISMLLSNSTFRSSWIYASNSAMGCSKSRKFKSMMGMSAEFLRNGDFIEFRQFIPAYFVSPSVYSYCG